MSLKRRKGGERLQSKAWVDKHWKAIKAIANLDSMVSEQSQAVILTARLVILRLGCSGTLHYKEVFGEYLADTSPQKNPFPSVRTHIGNGFGDIA